MYCLRVYFHGPQTEWMGKVSQMEVLMERDVPWLWLAKALARSYLRDLNTGRCGCVISKGDEIVSHQIALKSIGA